MMLSPVYLSYYLIQKPQTPTLLLSLPHSSVHSTCKIVILTITQFSDTDHSEFSFSFFPLFPWRIYRLVLLNTRLCLKPVFILNVILWQNSSSTLLSSLMPTKFTPWSKPPALTSLRCLSSIFNYILGMFSVCARTTCTSLFQLQTQPTDKGPPSSHPRDKLWDPDLQWDTRDGTLDFTSPDHCKVCRPTSHTQCRKEIGRWQERTVPSLIP